MRAILIAAAVVASGAPTFAAAADCTGVFKFIPNDRLTIQELSRIARDAMSQKGPSDTILIAAPTDYEDTVDRGRWLLWGVVYGAWIGAGGTVAGGTLWVSDREAFGTEGGGVFRRAKDGVSLTIRPSTALKGCKGGFTFKLDPQGRLFANGAIVGRAKDVLETSKMVGSMDAAGHRSQGKPVLRGPVAGR